MVAQSQASWLSQLRTQKYSLLPSNSSPPTPDLRGSSSSSNGGGAVNVSISFRKRLFIASIFALAFIGTTGYTLRSSVSSRIVAQPYRHGLDSNPDSGWSENPSSSSEEDELTTDDDGDDNDASSAGIEEMWGLSEGEGWAPPRDSGLADLGEVAEGRYRLNTEPGEEGSRAYFARLYDFAISLPMALHVPLLTSLYTHAPPRYPSTVPSPPFMPDWKKPSPAMISYKTIHQTDKTYNPDNELTQEWKAMNEADGWELNFMDDGAAQGWLENLFGGSQVEWAWNFMHRGVLKADFLRYILPLVLGGVYSDVDTRPIRPIEQWGQTNVEYLSLASTDGLNWRSKLSTHPAVIVAIDVDVHSYPHWENSWPRPLGICQWTLSSAPSHPIFLDAVRRVVNASHVVQDWENWRTDEIQRLDGEGRSQEAKELADQHRDHAMNVMEWTGPGLFTDSVLAYILARYNVTWHRLRGLDHPLRIGDVLILPITGFSPGGQPDFKAEGPDSPQANVLHNCKFSTASLACTVRGDHFESLM
ncbi:hypothetical protein I317_05600 [Kwoniella heveanensis CBS 569]|uniref:Alpha 1,6-mannosyltransferase n=1 Tax=Kwoniella heveanensis BCC8398 TaxID=1296120 RepID=A0A1B9GN29_9TREE|nr:hypothetical protein I316_05826 [Kwoniella heveanensis BCC8398]OCF40590.1 hypothetical protein I317_05600 [Kwoniella heveanensis CBS 569]